MADRSPIAPSERVAVLDVLRGFALFGVLIANACWFNAEYFEAELPGAALDASAIDVVAREWMRFFVSSKAMTTLSFLFGFGFSVTLMRAGARGEDGRGLFARRLVVLIAFGWCHAALLWWGDILWTYGLCGFALLAFRKATPRQLLLWAAAIWMMQFVVRLPMITEAQSHLVPASDRPPAITRDLIDGIYGGSWSDLVGIHVRYSLYWLLGTWSLFAAVIGRFLLGFYAGKRGLFDRDGADHLPLFRRLLGWGLAVNVVAYLIGTAMYWVRAHYTVLWPGKMALRIIDELGALGMAAASISLVVLLMQRPRARRWLLIVAPVGRMPLTTYLCQSVFAATLYFDWGFGFAKTVSGAGTVAISFGFFAIQLAIAHVWLRHFRFGPADWLWRSIVYGRWQPMRI